MSGKPFDGVGVERIEREPGRPEADSPATDDPRHDDLCADA